MKTEWTINVHYLNKQYSLKTLLEYHSTQIMRIRVKGKFNDLLFENNYPALKAKNSKKGIKWKLKEGRLTDVNHKSTLLITHILQELEYTIKHDFI